MLFPFMGNKEDIDEIIKGFKEKAEELRKAGEEVTGANLIEYEKLLALSIGERIGKMYSSIEDAIKKLDSMDPKLSEKKQLLLDMKREVPTKFAVKKEEMEYLNDALNAIIGINVSKPKED